MTSRHQLEAEALAKRLRSQNAASGKRANKAHRRFRGSIRASRNAGSWNSVGLSPATLIKINGGGRAADTYAEKSKGALFLDSNMLSLNSKDRAAEWDLEQARHPNVKNLFQHISISRPAGQDLSPSEWKFLLKDFLQEIGAEGVSFTSMIHTNTPNQHIHVIFSRALPNGKLLSDSQNFYRWRSALRRAEEKNGLKPIRLDCNSSANTQKTLSDRHLSATRRASRLKTESTFVDPHLIEQAIDRSSDIISFLDLLEQQQIEAEISKHKDGSPRGILFRQRGANDYLAGTTISRDLSLNQITQRIEVNRMNQEYQRRMQNRTTQRNIQIHNFPRERG